MKHSVRSHHGAARVGRWAALAAVVVAHVAGSVPARAQVTCGTVISAKVVMTADLAGCMTDPAVTVAGGGSLDMDGHQISGCMATGVVLSGAGAKLSNGSVNGCVTGVQLAGTGTHKVNKVAAVDNDGIGFQITSSSNKLADCSAIDNGDDGFSISGNKNAVKLSTSGGNVGDGFDVLGDNNNLTQNVVIGSVRGITVAGDANKLSRNTATANQQGLVINGDGNKLLQNSATGATMSGGMSITGGTNLLAKNVAADNVGAGFAFNGSDNKLSNNTATDNTLVGFSFDGNGNNVKGCFANRNGSHGIVVASGSGNLLKSNITMANTGNGVLVALGTTNGAVAKTVALENGGNDLQDDNANCDGNVWSNSVFRTSAAGGVSDHMCIQ